MASTSPANRQLSISSTRGPTTADDIVSNYPADFLQTLPTLQLSDLDREDASCSICHEPYASGPDAEKAAQLPCGHHFGLECLNQWLSSTVQPTCPMCRATLFPEAGEEASSLLQDSIRILSQLVSNTAPITTTMDDAERYTRKRIRNARRDARQNAVLPSHGEDVTSETTALQVFNLFQRMATADLHMAQPLDINQWNRLKRQIACVRQQVIGHHGNMGTLWDCRAPRLTELLNPVLRILVEEFLRKLVAIESGS